MAASLKQDYGRILAAGADLVMISPDSLEQHRQLRPRALRRGTALSLRFRQQPRHRAALRPAPRGRTSPRRILLSLTLDIEPRHYDHCTRAFPGKATQRLKSTRNYSRSSAANRENGAPPAPRLTRRTKGSERNDGTNGIGRLMRRPLNVICRW